MDLPDLIDSQRVFTDREDTDSPPFNGTRNNVTYADGVLKLANPALKITGTYNQTGREISISINSLPVYNISVGETLQINFTSGRSKSGIYTVKTMGVPNSTYLTVEADNIINPATAGTVSIDRGLRGSYIFQSLLDCGSIFALNLKRYIQTISFALGGETIQATYERKSATFGSTVNAFT
ncbi:MAG: hypothetical protein CM15mV46_330 [Caudoviricetes sp.]|nr:MAG: hypothetical protein CM15mV46_330 [Caudoviricetes sp.]